MNYICAYAVEKILWMRYENKDSFVSEIKLNTLKLKVKLYLIKYNLIFKSFPFEWKRLNTITVFKSFLFQHKEVWPGNVKKILCENILFFKACPTKYYYYLTIDGGLNGRSSWFVLSGILSELLVVFPHYEHATGRGNIMNTNEYLWCL